MAKSGGAGEEGETREGGLGCVLELFFDRRGLGCKSGRAADIDGLAEPARAVPYSAR